jgi:hypothetical protein
VKANPALERDKIRRDSQERVHRVLPESPLPPLSSVLETAVVFTASTAAADQHERAQGFVDNDMRY